MYDLVFVQDIMESGRMSFDTDKLLGDVGMRVNKPKPNIVYLAGDGFENKNDQSFFLTKKTQYCDEFVEDVQEWTCTSCLFSL